jgi:hypothetical protein
MLASVIAVTSVMKGDINLHVVSKRLYVIFYFLFSKHLLYHSIIETGSMGQLADFPLDVRKLLFLLNTT